MNDQVISLQQAVEKIQGYLGRNKGANAKDSFLALVTGEQAEVFNLLGPEESAAMLELLDVDATADLFDRLTDSDTLEAAEYLSIEDLADVLEEMQPDEAADLLGDLSEEQAAQALEEMEEVELVLPLLAYADETAGGRMTTEFIAMQQKTSVEKALQLLRDISPDHEVPYYVFVIDQAKKLSGVLGLRELVISSPHKIIEEIMDANVVSVRANMDQEEVAHMMARHELSAMPVVDSSQKMVGVITHDDILDVVSEEATEDMFRLAAVASKELEPDSPVGQHIRGRLPWLLLNTLTALFAAWIISHYEFLIVQVAALAVFQTVVAGLGGNASSQTVAVIVRSIALGRTSPDKVWKVLRREFVVGLIQGMAIGGIVALGVWFWRGNPYLGLVVGIALLGNLVVAGLVGAFIPLTLKAAGRDPALASSVLVTAVTDSVGFLIFLSLAAYFLPRLL